MCYPLAIRAESYSWIDEHGTVNFSDNPMSIPKNKRVKAKKRTVLDSAIPTAVPSAANNDFPQIAESIDYYDITGRNEIELRQQMSNKGYQWTDGKRYAGMTFWTVHWTTYPRMERDLCAVDKIAASVDVNFRLPRWADISTGSSNVRNWWTWYYDGLLKHENGHRDFGVNAAREVQRKIAGIQPYSTCTELYEAANKVGDSVLAKYQQLERDYDARTNHGRDQDAAYR